MKDKEKKKKKDRSYNNPATPGMAASIMIGGLAYGADKLLNYNSKKAKEERELKKRKKEMKEYKREQKVEKFKSLFKM